MLTDQESFIQLSKILNMVSRLAVHSRKFEEASLATGFTTSLLEVQVSLVFPDLPGGRCLLLYLLRPSVPSWTWFIPVRTEMLHVLQTLVNTCTCVHQDAGPPGDGW